MKQKLKADFRKQPIGIGSRGQPAPTLGPADPRLRRNPAHETTPQDYDAPVRVERGKVTLGVGPGLSLTPSGELTVDPASFPAAAKVFDLKDTTGAVKKTTLEAFVAVAGSGADAAVNAAFAILQNNIASLAAKQKEYADALRKAGLLKET